jgi:hypothetical protein
MSRSKASRRGQATDQAILPFAESAPPVAPKPGPPFVAPVAPLAMAIVKGMVDGARPAFHGFRDPRVGGSLAAAGRPRVATGRPH